MFVAGLHSVLRNFLNPEAPPNKVLEVITDRYVSRDILYREDALILYAPSNSTNKKDKSYYEILFNKHYTETVDHAFSLFRSDDKEEAENKFVCYKDKIPQFIDFAKEMANINGLQRLCDILTENPTWTVAHLASQFEILEAFKHPSVITLLNKGDTKTGISPLQLAVSSKCLSSVKVLINSKCSLEHLDHEGNNVYHYAASTNKDIISALMVNGSTYIHVLNSRNYIGQTPLHIACFSNKQDCVKALLLGGADVNLSISPHDSANASSVSPSFVGNFLQDNPKVALSQEDMKFGGTPLHWSSSRIVIEALLNVQCNINATNFDNRTALHVMVLRNRFECVITLLSHNADPDIGDNDGDRPIHLAVKEGNVPIIQALIIFGANLDVLNNKGETPRHSIKNDKDGKVLYLLHAVGASRCHSDMFDCTPCCRFDGTYDGIPPPPVTGPSNRDLLNEMLSAAGMEAAAQKKSNKKGRLLCLDGGGIRGLVLIQMLLEMEKIINRPINNCFDWIAGTSTGGILALGIATGKTLQECLCLYFRMKEVTFVGLRPYPSDPLEGVLKETFGTNTVMSEIKHPKLLITGVLADRKPVELHLFRNYPSPSEILEGRTSPEHKDQLLWHVGRATGAAPTYFRSFGKYLDGGLISNNPTLDALSEIHELNLALRSAAKIEDITDLSLVVSLGTGLVPVTELKVDVYRPESVWDSAKLVIGMSSLGSLLVDQATASDGSVVTRARAWCSSIGVPYYRFSPQMSEDIAMDEKSDEKLVKILWESKAYIHENLHMIQEVANLL